MEPNKEQEQIRVRKDKLEALKLWAKDQSAYPNHLKNSHWAKPLHEEFDACSKEQLAEKNCVVSLAGRIKARRDFGKASFLEVQDHSGGMQIYVRLDDLKDDASRHYAKFLDLGDIVFVSGFLFKTKTDALSVHCEYLVLLTKSLRPMPEKFHGLTDIELKYRHRYLDLIVDAKSRQTFVMRSLITDHLRTFLKERGFMEVETPMLQPIAGGAAARPFVTHHHALDLELYLRIAPELYLKRLVVGGFDRVFEINRNFRNEGLSTRHNPEFTMIELYQAYATYEDLMEMCEQLFLSLSHKLHQSPVISYQGQQIDFSAPWKRLSVEEGIRTLSGFKGSTRDQEALKQYVVGANYAYVPEMSTGALLMLIFEQEVEQTLQAPTFVTQYPIEVSPLSRRNDLDPFLADRFELVIGGREIANAFSELNDPIDQRQRFEAQVLARAKGDLEASELDADFLLALEYGLPPTAGAGIGVDRLTMLFTDAASIRDVILFPLMKPVS